MDIIEIIIAKKDGKVLTKEQIHFFIKGLIDKLTAKKETVELYNIDDVQHDLMSWSDARAINVSDVGEFGREVDELLLLNKFNRSIEDTYKRVPEERMNFAIAHDGIYGYNKVSFGTDEEIDIVLDKINSDDGEVHVFDVDQLDGSTFKVSITPITEDEADEIEFQSLKGIAGRKLDLDEVRRERLRL